MRCDEFEEQVHRALDQRATPWSCEPQQQHARTCAACRNLLSAYEALSDGLSFFEDEGPDANFSQSIVSQLTAARPRAHRRRVLATAMVVIAASVLLLVLPRILPQRSALDKTPPRQTAEIHRPPDRQVEGSVRLAEVIEPNHRPQNAASVDQVTAILSEWRNRWSFAQWKPVDGLEGGFAPITTPLSIAIDELRSTIPLGRSTRPAEDPSDSAGTWSAAHPADTA